MTEISKIGLTDEQYANVSAIQEGSKARASGEKPPATSSSQSSMDAILAALQDKILGEGGVVSSEDTGFEKAIAGIQEAGQATEQRIESQWGREIDYATGQANVRRTQQLEGRRGFATQKVALKLLEESNIKYIGDLQRQKEDAMLANDAQTAQQVAGMQVQAMQYEQQEKQNYFSNLLSVGQMAISTQQLQEQIRMNAQSMSQFEWQKTIDQASMDFQQSRFDYEKIYNKSILNQQDVANKLREQEMRLKYGDDPTEVKPNEGFASVDWQMATVSLISPLAMALSKDINSGSIKDDEVQDEIDRIFKMVRRQIPEEAASDEALLDLLNIEPEEPEEEEQALPGAIPAVEFFKGVGKAVEYPGKKAAGWFAPGGREPSGFFGD